LSRGKLLKHSFEKKSSGKEIKFDWLIIYDVNFTSDEGRKKSLKFLKVDVSLLLCGARTFMEFCHVSTVRQERKLKRAEIPKTD
jgi:hypothetical protein